MGTSAAILLIRADANTHIGTGHIMRCLALAQAWLDSGGQAIFVTSELPGALEERLTAEGMQTIALAATAGSNEDAIETAHVAHDAGASWVVVDGYHFDAEYQHRIKEQNLRLLFIDDYGHAQHYYADLVLNQNIHACGELYTSREAYTQLLLGTRYVLLRREFWPWRGWQREIPPVARKILVTMGGSDPDNVTLKVIQALGQENLPELEVVVVVGGSNPHYSTLHRSACDSLHNISLVRNATNMPELMTWADLAISAAGSTCWELALVGVPSMLLILAENQQPIAEYLDRADAAINRGWHNRLNITEMASLLSHVCRNAEIRTRLSQRMHAFVDGEGIERVFMRLKSQPLRLRPVREQDCELLWQWANDPQTRLASFSTAYIPWEQHIKWFASQIKNVQCLFFIGLNKKDLPVGQIRFNVHANRAIISVSIDAAFRGCGYGSDIICSGSKRIFETTDVEVIDAYVRPENTSSIQAFLKVGFKQTTTTTVDGQLALHLILYRSGVKNERSN